MTKRIESIQDLCPDDLNANRGTERGHAMIEDSLRQLGAGRSIVVDKRGCVISGNKTLESAANIGLDEIVVVQTDGRKLVVVQRTDLDLEKGGKARRLAVADNRTGQLNLDWDPAILSQLQAEEAGLLDGLFRDDELERLLSQLPDADDWAATMGGLPDGDKAPFQQMTFTVSDGQAESIKRALKAAKDAGEFGNTGNENSNGNALSRICEAYVG